MSTKWEISPINSTQAEYGTNTLYTLCACPSYKAVGCQVSNISPFLALNLKHFTDRKAGAGRSGRKIRERLPRSAVRASRKDLYFHVYIWHFSSFPGKSLASRVCSTDNATFFNIPPSQYSSTSLMKVFFYVLLYNGHKILTLAEA